MEEEIARVDRFRITMLKGQGAERKYCLRYLSESDSKQGILAIQRAFPEKKLRDMATVFQQAVDYIDQS